MTQEKTTDGMFLVFNDRVAKYLAKNGIYWHELRVNRSDYTRPAFAYTEPEEVIRKYIEEYKENKQSFYQMNKNK